MLRIGAIILAGGLMAAASQAADLQTASRAHGAHRHHLTHATTVENAYPWTWRSRKIRFADSCWRGCEATAGHAFHACLRSGDTNGCVQHNDAADRSCLWTCRIYGGPLVDWAE